MGIDSVVGRLHECIDGTAKALREVDSSGDQGQRALDVDGQRRLQWLERQLSVLITQLQGIMLDLESGLSFGDLGYGGEDEFGEMLDDIEVEIRQLQRMIREVKGIGR